MMLSQVLSFLSSNGVCVSQDSVIQWHIAEQDPAMRYSRHDCRCRLTSPRAVSRSGAASSPVPWLPFGSQRKGTQMLGTKDRWFGLTADLHLPPTEWVRVRRLLDPSQSSCSGSSPPCCPESAIAPVRAARAMTSTAPLVLSITQCRAPRNTVATPIQRSSSHRGLSTRNRPDQEIRDIQARGQRCI